MAIAAAVAVLVSGCSDVSFPAVHDMPAPRADTPLTPDQVKQATDELASQRDRLSTEAQSAASANPAPGPISAAAPAASAQAPQPTQTAGAYAKP